MKRGRRTEAKRQLPGERRSEDRDQQDFRRFYRCGPDARGDADAGADTQKSRSWRSGAARSAIGATDDPSWEKLSDRVPCQNASRTARRSSWGRAAKLRGERVFPLLHAPRELRKGGGGGRGRSLKLWTSSAEVMKRRDTWGQVAEDS